MYSIGSIVESRTIKNIPEQTAGILKVYNSNGGEHIAGSYSYLKQEFYPYSEISAYGRFIHTESNADIWLYNDWVKMY